MATFRPAHPPHYDLLGGIEMIRLRTALALPLLLASCQDTQEVTVAMLQDVMVLPAIPNPNLDLLFVVDNSPSMLDKQESLRESFPLLMDQLASLEGGLPSVHIGVVTTDMGTTATSGVNGPNLGAGPGSCSGMGDDGVLVHDVVPELGGAYFVSDIRNADGTRTRNYTGELRDVFAALANVQAGGCGFEQPLHAMQRALENPANAGFLRPDANLAVVILSDEDDCSVANLELFGTTTAELGALQSFRCTRFGVTCDVGGKTPDEMNTLGAKSGCHSNEASLLADVASYADFLKELKGDPNSVMVSAITGTPTVAVELRTPPGGGAAIPALSHSCTYEGRSGPELADPGVRLADFVASFPARSALTSICDANLELPLTTIGAATKPMMGDACVQAALVDTGKTPGIQPHCEVIDGPVGAETEIPACAEDATGTCWTLVLDTAKCGGVADNLRLEITRPSPPTSQLYTHLRCLTTH